MMRKIGDEIGKLWTLLIKTNTEQRIRYLQEIKYMAFCHHIQS